MNLTIFELPLCLSNAPPVMAVAITWLLFIIGMCTSRPAAW